MASFYQLDDDLPVSPINHKVIDTDTLSLDIGNMKFMDNFDLLEDNLSTSWNAASVDQGPLSSFGEMKSTKKESSSSVPVNRSTSPLRVTVPFDFPIDNGLSRSSSYVMNNPPTSMDLRREHSDVSVTSFGFGSSSSFGLLPPQFTSSSSSSFTQHPYPLVREISNASFSSEYLHMDMPNMNGKNTTTIPMVSSLPMTVASGTSSSSSSSLLDVPQFSPPSTNPFQPKFIRRGEVYDKANTLPLSSSTVSTTVPPSITTTMVKSSSSSSSSPAFISSSSKLKNRKRARDNNKNDEENDDDEGNDDDEDDEDEVGDEDDDQEDESSIHASFLYPSSTMTTLSSSTSTSSSPYHDIHNLVVLPLPIIRSLGKKGGRIPYSMAYRYENTEGERLLYPENTRMIGVYSYSFRQERLQAWENLRNRRIFYKKVKYRQRRLLANGRQRVKGRFVKEAAPLTITTPLVFTNPDDAPMDTTNSDHE